MRQLLAVANFTVLENISNKIFNTLMLFGVLTIFITRLLKDLSLYETISVIRNSGLFLIEFFVLIITLFISTNAYLKDKEQKSIYLVLTKPISKPAYIFGRYLGSMLTIFYNVLIMGIILGILLISVKGKVDYEFIVSLLFIFYKLSMLAAIGLLISIITDSFIVSNLCAFSIYIVSHSSIEIKMMADKVTNIFFKYILNFVYYILPNYRALNYRDFLVNIKHINLVTMSLYVLGYTIVTICITNFIFINREL